MAANDLDLDELHEAVNALMDQAGKGKTKKAPVLPFVEKQQAALAEPPKKAVSANAGEKIAVKRPLPTLVTNRSRGRTMDAMNPKPTPKIAPPSVQAKRQAPTLQPTGAPIVPDPPKAAASPPPAPQSSFAEPGDDVLASIDMKQELPQPTLTHQKSEWPDPLEVHGFKDQEPSQEDPELVGNPVSPIKPDPDDERPERPAAEEANTPFVTTKVEKRPLGAFAATPPPVEKPEPATVETSQPKEFSPEVIAVESAEPALHQQPEKEADMDDLRQMAIPQQYQQAPKTSGKDSRPVFDTKEYHPPIVAAHTAHRTGSSLGWVLILLFAVILVGALIAAYYMMTGSLDLTQLLNL
ncbi:MAG TPA: hypothetical protein VFT87_05770 [Candidatus Saccharimonadales bacterium]|nr:hypothetical protein [Candidatus Saccharimonadales bacterium]